MIYILRLIYAWLLPPGLIILAALAAILLFCKTKIKRWLLLPVLFIYLFSISAVSNTLIKPLEDYYPQPSLQELRNAQAIVVLGGGAIEGVPDFDGNGQIASDTANRILMSLRLHKALQIPLILAGGQGYTRTITEAEIGARTLKACGVEDNSIIIEDKSRNTRENATYTKRLFQQKSLRKVILVTSAYHLPRSTLLFRREGMDVIPYPTDYKTSKIPALNAFSFTPLQSNLSNSATAIKEYLGIIAVKTKLQ